MIAADHEYGESPASADATVAVSNTYAFTKEEWTAYYNSGAPTDNLRTAALTNLV